MTEAEIENVKKDYLEGMKYNDIMEKYHITKPELRSIIRRNKLTRTKSNAQIGNRNSVGNKGGHPALNNKNAVATGEYEKIYEDVLEDEEKELYRTLNVEDKEELLLNDYRILTIREKRMMKRIQEIKAKEKDMTINFIRSKKSKSETETITDAEPTLNLIQRIEDGLTRVQEAKRKCIDSLARLNNGNDVNVNLVNTSSLLQSINRQLGGGNNGTK